MMCHRLEQFDYKIDPGYAILIIAKTLNKRLILYRKHKISYS